MDSADGPPDGSLRALFAYDYLGRRVSKVVEIYNAGTQTWTPSSRTVYVWAGWLLLAELEPDVLPNPTTCNLLRSYTWGLDLAGQNGQVNSLESAGGIGGLLAVSDANGTPGNPNDDLAYAYTYDANGNVAQLVAWETGYGGATGNDLHEDRLVAHYEYDPYGNVTNDLSGYAYAETNRWRFSTKQFDAATGLGYWGYRYYDPVLGRWLNRDPIGEAGGVNLYAYVNNCPSLYVDAWGLDDYTVGSVPPPALKHDVGSGSFDSDIPTRKDDIIRQKWYAAARAAAALGYHDAARHMKHFLDASGRTLTVDVCRMVDESADAKKHFYDELNSAMAFAENVQDTSFEITSQRWSRGYNQSKSSWNWFYAVGGYSAYGRGFVRRNEDCTYSIAFTFVFEDMYNWDAKKSTKLGGYDIKDSELGRLHKVGMGREFLMKGQCTREFTWCGGQQFDAEGRLCDSLEETKTQTAKPRGR